MSFWNHRVDAAEVAVSDAADSGESIYGAEGPKVDDLLCSVRTHLVDALQLLEPCAIDVDLPSRASALRLWLWLGLRFWFWFWFSIGRGCVSFLFSQRRLALVQLGFTCVELLFAFSECFRLRLALAEQRLLVRGEALYPWSFAGYGAPLPRRAGTVRVLTPRSVVGAIANGLAPQIHASADACRNG
jgi:hypothetical protein